MRQQSGVTQSKEDVVAMSDNNASKEQERPTVEVDQEWYDNVAQQLGNIFEPLIGTNAPPCPLCGRTNWNVLGASDIRIPYGDAEKPEIFKLGTLVTVCQSCTNVQLFYTHPQESEDTDESEGESE